jgi:predicted nucleic acid-binding Zn ribbon protein
MADRKPGRRSPTPLSALLSNSFRGRPLEKRLGEVEIWRIWEKVVGSQIASKAQPSRFTNGVLTVIVISAPWMQQLNFMKRDIAERLNEKLGAHLVNEIFLKAGKPPAPDKTEVWVKPVKRELTEAEKETIAAAVAAVHDPQLRSQFAKLLEQDLAHTPKKD